MQKRKRMKGFTLIELLAVIVILAIIALIAVPVIMNIINKANKSAFKDTAYGIISAGELYFAEQQLDLNGMSEDETIELPDTTNTLGLKGEIPEGSIKISKEGKIALAVHNGRYCITKGFEDTDITVTENYEKCELPKEPNPNISSTSECVTSGTCSDTEINNGIKVNVKVNDKENYDFYVISDNGTELTLIMDRNIGTQVAWVTKVDYNDDTNYGSYGKTDKGPITTLNYLNNQTANWTNIDPIESYTYDNNLNDSSAYQKLEITNGEGVLTSKDGATTTTLTGVSRARLLTYEEADALCRVNSYKTPTWLYTNLSSSNTTEVPKAYWFLTTHPPYTYDVRAMYYDGVLTYNNMVSNETTHGTRPVITLSKNL